MKPDLEDDQYIMGEPMGWTAVGIFLLLMIGVPLLLYLFR